MDKYTPEFFLEAWAKQNNKSVKEAKKLFSKTNIRGFSEGRSLTESGKILQREVEKKK